jgi:pimeloyl-ACP methyl ester carboxylesterase
MASSSVSYEAVLWIAFGGFETRIVDVKRRAVGAEDLIVLTHIKIDVRVVEGRPRAHAIELLDADEDSLGAHVICEMRNNCSGHASPSATGDVWPHHILVASMMVGDIKTFEQVSGGGMDHFDSDGVDIAFLDTGGGDGKPPILLIHGFASNVETNWVNTGWVSFLTKAGYRVLAFDNRGHGESQKLYELVDYGAPLMAEDARRLLDHVGVARTNVIGYSMGARIAAFLALTHPDRVMRIVVGGLGINMVRGMAGTGPIARALEAPSIDDVTNPAARTFRAFAEQTKSDLKALAACIRSSRAPITAQQVGEIAIPVLVAVGETDVIGGSAEDLAKLIPGARAHTIRGKDHNRAVGDPTFKTEALAFFEGAATSGPGNV